MATNIDIVSNDDQSARASTFALPACSEWPEGAWYRYNWWTKDDQGTWPKNGLLIYSSLKGWWKQGVPIQEMPNSMLGGVWPVEVTCSHSSCPKLSISQNTCHHNWSVTTNLNNDLCLEINPLLMYINATLCIPGECCLTIRLPFTSLLELL